MKIKILIFVLVFIPAIAYAQADLDYEVLRDSEINRTLALMETEAEYTSYYEEATPEYTYTSSYATYAPAEETYYVTSEETPLPEATTTTQTQATTAPTQEWYYTPTQEVPPPPVELPPIENKIHRELSERIKSVFGERASGSLGFNTGFIRGFTRYHISFDNPEAIGGHGESELVWPLDNALIGVEGCLHYRTKNSTQEEPRDLIRLGLEWYTRLDKSSGNILDSDWIENDVGFIDWNDGPPYYTLDNSSAWATNHDGKDIYSESAAKLDRAHIFDINCTYNFWPTQNWAIGPRIGYRHQKFNFYDVGLKQVGYGPYEDPRFDMSYTDTEGLRWLEYVAKYRIPYLGLSSELLWKNLSFFFTFGYSNWVRIHNQDTHLYPTLDRDLGFNVDMVSPGNTRGRAFLIGFGGGWKFWPDWLLNIDANYVNIDTSGTVTQNTYADGALVGVSDPISEKITSKYWLTSASLKYVF